jgi:hypothetical protein
MKASKRLWKNENPYGKEDSLFEGFLIENGDEDG